MDKQSMTRRGFQLAGVGAAFGAFGIGWRLRGASAESSAPESGEDALSRLKAGNERFVAGKLRHPHLGNDWRKRLAGGQKPFATILGCSDSRVPPELLFDQGFGDLFVVRVAGNVIDTDVAGSVEYGVDHLGTKLVVVMGHEGCGAVTAALQPDEKLANEPNEIQALVGRIKPGLSAPRSEQPFEKRLTTAVEENVRTSVQQLRKVPDLGAAEKANRTTIIGCVYEIGSGRVRMLN